MRSRQAKTVKVVLIGPKGAGKSCVSNWIAHKEFDDVYSETIGANFVMAQNFISDFKIALWDTSGNERFSALSPMYLRNSKVTLLVIDPLSKDLENDLAYVKSILSKAQIETLLLVATKKDLLSAADAGVIANAKLYVCAFENEFPQAGKALDFSSKDPSDEDKIKLHAAIEKGFNHFKQPEEKIENSQSNLLSDLKEFETKIKKRRFYKSTHSSRLNSIWLLRGTLSSLPPPNVEQQIEALVQEAKSLRKRDEDGKYKYGFTLFCMPLGSHQKSEYYQFLKTHVLALDPNYDFEEKTDPYPVPTRVSTRP